MELEDGCFLEEKGMFTHFSILVQNFMDRGAWQATVHEVAKNWDMTERLMLTLPDHTRGFPGGSVDKESAYSADTQVQSRSGEDPLEKGMVTHSSILAWRIPWTEEPGRLQSMRLQRTGHD